MKKNIIDIAFAVAAGLVVAVFGWAYGIVSACGAPRDLPRGELPVLCVFFLHHALVGLFIPIFVLLAGAILAFRRSETGVRVTVAAGWLAALVWLCILLLVWQLPSIPVFTGMRWHY